MDDKATLHRYLNRCRDALLWKLEGLSEADARLPRTPTGTNLAGIVKHCSNVEIGYFGLCFGREWPEPDDPCYVAEERYADEPQADWYLGEHETVADLVDFHHRARTFCDQTIDELPLDAPGVVPWWSDGEVTLHQIMVHVHDDLARHAGQADILREQIDGSAGLVASTTNLPDGIDWPAYVARLTGLAESRD